MITKLFDIIPGFVWAILLALMTVLAGTNYVRLKSEQTAHEHTKVMMAKATQEMERQARAKEQELRQQVDKVAQNAQAKAVELTRRADTAIAAVKQLRDTIATLNAREPATNPTTAPGSNATAQARELLGSCAEEYRAVAADADGLRDQVVALQEYAVSVSNHEPRKDRVQR